MVYTKEPGLVIMTVIFVLNILRAKKNILAEYTTFDMTNGERCFLQPDGVVSGINQQGLMLTS